VKGARRAASLHLVKRYHVTTFGCQMNEHDSERMKGMLDALGYVEAPAPDEADVLLEYDPTRQPPDATGPFEWGVFSAKLNDLPAAYGRTEHLALSALAKQLLKLAATRRKARGLTILDQAMAAADHKPIEDLARWLTDRAEEPVRHKTSNPGLD
jgi:hypothetical protein